MKDHVADLIRGAGTPDHARSIVREYLQARILGCLQRAGAMVPLAFHGGTSLRLLYALPRYSEDLDFALERPSPQYGFRGYLHAILSDFDAEGYAVGCKANDRKVVHSAFIHFAGLLYELGLSPHRDQALSVKLEVDTNPPAGAGLATTVVRRHVILQVQHHDRATLLAGKLHAILTRPYLKGRDVFDLFWYLSDADWPEPNMEMLNNALRQTGWNGQALSFSNWRQAVRSRLENVPWEQVLNDTRPFLEANADMGFLTQPNLMRLLE